MNIPKPVVPILVFIGLAALVILSNRPPAAPNGENMITSNAQFEDTSDAALALCREPLAKFDRDELLTEEDKANLEKALKSYELMGLYKPAALEPAFQAGRIHFALGRPEDAELILNQAVLNGDSIMQNPDNRANTTVLEATRLTLAEARYVRSLVFQQLGEFEKARFDANYAVNEVPNSPNYLVARASTNLELKNVPDAIRDVRSALKLEPEHRRAIQLAKLIDSVSPPKSSSP